MTGTDLMTIGVFAQRCGLTASALRFYADSGLLPPARVDAVSGYRFYAPAQIEHAVLIRRLREIGMSLEAVKSAAEAPPGAVVRLVDAHLDRLGEEVAIACERAAAVKADLSDEPSATVASLSGPVLAAAVEQVLAATTSAPGTAVLDGVRFESGPGSVVLTATDRYRLATRTIVAESAAAVTWAATVHADDLRDRLEELRRSPRVALAASRHGVVLRCRGGQERHCRILTDPYPDFRGMIDRLPEARTRVVAGRIPLLRAMEAIGADHLLVNAVRGELVLRGARDHGEPEARVPAAVAGPDMDVGFPMTTLYPAVGSAVGADLLIDLRGPENPATIRSADDGDLTALAMPASPET